MCQKTVCLRDRILVSGVSEYSRFREQRKKVKFHNFRELPWNPKIVGNQYIKKQFYKHFIYKRFKCKFDNFSKKKKKYA